MNKVTVQLNKFIQLRNTRFFRYGVNGVIALCAELLSFFMLKYAFPGLPIILYNSVSIIVGLLVGYDLQRRLFNTQFKNYGQITRYLTLVVINLFLSNALLSALNELFDNLTVAKLITPFMVALWNYFLFKKVIFIKRN